MRSLISGNESGFPNQGLQKILKTQSLLLSCNISVLERGYLSLVNRDGLKIRSRRGSRVQIPPLALFFWVTGKYGFETHHFRYVGTAARTIMLAAAERGLGGCMLGSIHREQLSTVLVLPEKYEIQLVLAIGYPAESIVLEPLEQNGDTRYWRDEQGIRHVPKRSLKDIVLTTSG